MLNAERETLIPALELCWIIREAYFSEDNVKHSAFCLLL